jgi:hypothetical protein
MKIIQVGVGGFGASWLDIVASSKEWGRKLIFKFRFFINDFAS